MQLKRHRVVAEKPFHSCHKVGLGSLDDEVEVIAHEAVGVEPLDLARICSTFLPVKEGTRG